MAKAKRCQFSDVTGRCKNDATVSVVSESPRDHKPIDLCQEHDEFVKAYFLAQAAARLPEVN